VINVQTNAQTTKLQIEVWIIHERVHNKYAQALINALDGLLARASHQLHEFNTINSDLNLN
jgi:hypothetical protein